MSAKDELQVCRFASVLLICACGEIDNPSGPVGGGNSNSGGNAGSAMVGPGGSSSGSGGSGAEPDAGPETGTANGGSSGYMYPDDCPRINPIPVEGQQIAIQSLNFRTSEIVLLNVSSQDLTITGGERGWQWCNIPAYDRVLQEDLVLEPDQTVAFVLVDRFGVRELFDGSDGGDPNELGIYTDTGSFMTADLMVGFVSWGEGYDPGGRENVASMALLWNYGDRIEIAPGHDGFVATGATDSGDGYTSVDSRCLVAPPNPPGTVLPEPNP